MTSGILGVNMVVLSNYTELVKASVKEKLIYLSSAGLPLNLPKYLISRP